MRLTFALGLNPYQVDLFNEIQMENVLVSFEYKSCLVKINYKPEYLVLDSGAFTAWNGGKSVDIVAYGDWVLANRDAAKRIVAVNLDVIPGEVGRTSTKPERTEGMKQSLANADYLRGRGIDVMEVFHQDEPLIFLDTLLDRLPVGGILGISPRNDVNVNSKLLWQNVVLRHLYQRFGVASMPKMHGLAVTSMRMLKGFPYYSVDSSTWASPMRYGQFVNEWGKMQPMEAIMPARPNQKIFRSGVLMGVRKSVEHYIHIGESMTTLWENRGIKWKD